MLRFLSLACAVAFLPTLATADDAPADPARQVIESQLAAFARDDAREAFGYAAPSIQAMFADPDQFLRMVEYHYPAVYRHRSVEFRDAAQKDDQAAEAVVFTDDDGKVWQAIYRLEKQEDGRWKISGCVLSPSSEQGL